MIGLIQECNITGSFQEQRMERKYRMEILRNYPKLLQDQKIPYEVPPHDILLVSENLTGGNWVSQLNVRELVKVPRLHG